MAQELERRIKTNLETIKQRVAVFSGKDPLDSAVVRVVRECVLSTR